MLKRQGESLELLGAPRVDDFGEVVGHEVLGTVTNCVVYPKSDSDTSAESYVSGDVSTLEVVAPGGTSIAGGSLIRFRGEVYTVDDLGGFDFGPGRRPVLSRHRVPTVFTMSRGEVSDRVD